MVDSNGRVLVDTDYGKTITKMTKHQIVSQAAVAMAGQANAIASTVSSLLETCLIQLKSKGNKCQTYCKQI